MLEKIKITHHSGEVEEHESDQSGGITAIGFQFYSKTVGNYILVHPQSVKKIEFKRSEKCQKE